MNDILGGNVAALLHERANGEPHGVAQTELVHQNLMIIIIIKYIILLIHF
jgi:hypothetical protein